MRFDLGLMLKRSAEEQNEDGVQSRVSSCRMTEPMRQRFQQLWETLSDIAARRRKAMVPIGTLPAQFLRR